MSVAHRATGTWAELTADGSVAIPATPQAGDRMYLLARWKDFSVTATVANWTELTEFADGSTTSGNGTGSVKVACWYRDWQPGDSDPTIDFSANPTNASVVITVMSKGADEVWDTPVARTAAMTTWTTTSQSVSASATVDVRSSGVVMGLIGIRDDTAVMTRPTNGVDDAGGLVTWNGNYVESPATHHSTTTGDDGAADLGYRLVTTGAAGATLRMTGTISAAETGAALWVVQGVSTLVIPSAVTLTVSWFAPLLLLAVIPATVTLTATGFAPQLREAITPASTSLTTTGFAPSLQTRITPSNTTLTITSSVPQLQQSLTPASAALTTTTFAPALQTAVVPAAANLSITSFTPTITQNVLITVPNATLTLTTSQPHVLPFRIVFLDPGGDAVQGVGYFNAVVADGANISFDSTQQAVGVGSYKFDSGDGTVEPNVSLVGALGGAPRRVSAYFRYSSIPDATATDSEFCEDNAIYSGGGFDNPAGTNNDDGVYATATPVRNTGQGSKMSVLGGGLDVPAGSLILSVKIVYERKYNVDTSIGISRVKWVVNGEEGPDHDNTAMPLTDTVVEVDVTGDRFWEWQDLQVGVIEVIGEALRGDTDTAHTQSWDFVKVEVVYHLPARILALMSATEQPAAGIMLSPRATGVVLRFTDGAGASYDGITILPPDTWPRISFAYIQHDTNDLDIAVFVNGIQELYVEGAHTNGVAAITNLQYGWTTKPGVDHLCWFDQLHIDDGDDLQDTGSTLSTTKLPATVNANNWNATIGTGAVNERPLSETNGKQHTTVTSVEQSYTLQAASVGDIDISGESLIGYMGWAWAKLGSGDTETVNLIVNGIQVDRTPNLSTLPSLIYYPVTSASYPSDAAGIGMTSNAESADTFMLECGGIAAYEGPPNPDILLERRLVDTEILPTIIDDLRAESITAYELCCNVQEFGGQVTIEIYSIDSEGGSPQSQGTMQSSGGGGRMRITPGIEVQIVVTVVGVTMLQIYRRTNFD